MKKYTIIILFVLIQLSILAAPSIRFERTDVEEKNANFVTATYSFGINIILDSLEYCSNVSFELYHNQTRHIKFSDYNRSEDWLINNDWSQVVTIVGNLPVDSASDKATIVIEAGTIHPASTNSPSHPKVIHLKFVVAPSAMNGGILEFTIGKIRAVYYDEEIIDTLIPFTFKVAYNIHSFVNVWPGDVDCNGLVDAVDISLIGKHLTEPKNSRSFKRQYASILWQPQLCIAWDTLPATFADCDGNGVVTTSDIAVVFVNYGKIHSDFCNVSPTGPIIESNNNLQLASNNGIVSKIDNSFLSDNKVISIAISNYSEDICGVAGIIDYNGLDIELEGIKAGDMFGEQVITTFYNNKDTKLAAFCIAIDKNYTPDYLTNNVAELYIKENDHSIDSINIIDFIAFDNFGNIKQLNQTYTSIKLEKENTFTANTFDDKLILSNIKELESISILNYLGSEVANFVPNTNNKYSIEILPVGIYFVVAKTKNIIYTTKFVIIR